MIIRSKESAMGLLLSLTQKLLSMQLQAWMAKYASCFKIDFLLSCIILIYFFNRKLAAVLFE